LGREKSKAMEMVRRIRPKAWLPPDNDYPAMLDRFEKEYRGCYIGK
jgi:hypothetical protein